MKHAIVIGGTGMLTGVVKHLLAEGYACSVVARRDRGLQGINLVQVDYTNQEAFKSEIATSIGQFGKPDMVVAWIHSIAPQAPFILAEEVQDDVSLPKFYHILGSAAANPDHQKKDARQQLSNTFKIDYREVILGFKLEGKSSRWLTDQEISSGIIQAISNDLPKYTVGQTEPWELKP